MNKPNSAPVFRYVTTIREFHLDTFGHVNNARYLDLLEEARWDLITKRGYGLKEVQKWKKGPVILEVTLSFRRELKLREEITITTEAVSYAGKVGELEQKILLHDGAEASVARFKFGLFDLTERRLIAPTPEWLQAIGYQISGS